MVDSTYEIEVGDFVLTKDIGGDFSGTLLDAEVAIKLFVPVPNAETTFNAQTARWLDFRQPMFRSCMAQCSPFMCEHMANGSLDKYFDNVTSLGLEFLKRGDSASTLVRSSRWVQERGIVHPDFRDVLQRILDEFG